MTWGVSDVVSAVRPKVERMNSELRGELIASGHASVAKTASYVEPRVSGSPIPFVVNVNWSGRRSHWFWFFGASGELPF